MSNNNEVRIKLEGLQIGMYVSRTDRAWEDLPVPLEGVIITSNDEIDMLNKYCSSVYIDTSKGCSANTMYWIIEDTHFDDKEISDKGNNEFTVLRKEHYEATESLNNELKTAKQIYDKVARKLQNIFDDLKENKELNLSDLDDYVTQTVNSVLRNPTAMRLVVEINKTHKYNCNHALSCSIWCALFGRNLGLAKSDIMDLSFGGMILDIGKSRIPKALFLKSGHLSVEEVVHLRSHVNIGIEMLASYDDDISHNVMRMVASHHERADGSGYPQGLHNKDIPIFSRIAGIVDSFDAMTSKRPFSAVILSPHEAIRNLYELRGRLFQPDLVEQFIQTMGMYPTGSLVELNSKEVAVVTETHGLKRLKPTVMLILDKNKQPFHEFKNINLSKQSTLYVAKSLQYGAFGIIMDELFL